MDPSRRFRTSAGPPSLSQCPHQELNVYIEAGRNCVPVSPQHTRARRAANPDEQNPCVPCQSVSGVKQSNGPEQGRRNKDFGSFGQTGSVFCPTFKDHVRFMIKV